MCSYWYFQQLHALLIEELKFEFTLKLYHQLYQMSTTIIVDLVNTSIYSPMSSDKRGYPP